MLFRSQAAALLVIGEQYWMTGDSQTAMEKFSRALPIVQKLGLKQGEAMVLLDMGCASPQLRSAAESVR